MSAQFRIQGLETGETNLLGMWQVVPSPGVSFGVEPTADATPETGEVVWSISLPASPGLARAAVQRQAATLAVTQHAISQAGQALQQLPDHWLEETSFALEPAAEGAVPETTLRRSLAGLQGGDAAISFRESAVSYGLDLPGDWSQTVADYKAFMGQVFRLLRPTLRVETQVEGLLLAYTRVGLSGDFETAWRSSEVSAHTQLHRQILSLTLESRLALLQLVAQAGAGAAALAAKFSLPGGAVLALPAAWRYIQDVMQQAQKIVDLQRQMEPIR